MIDQIPQLVVVLVPLVELTPGIYIHIIIVANSTGQLTKPLQIAFKYSHVQRPVFNNLKHVNLIHIFCSLRSASSNIS